MVIQVLHRDEVGKFLTVGADGKLNGMNAFKSAVVQDNSIVFTLLDETKATVALPTPTVDVKLTGAELTDDNKLKLTLSDGSEVKADLAKFVDAPKSAEEYWNEIKVLADFKTALIEILKSPEAKSALIEVLKGDEIQDFAGTRKGYLLATA